jgi:menaquinone-dependent protoporphyrinogen IX oxidase
MNTPVLVAYATKAGSTRDVAEAVAHRLRDHGLEAAWADDVAAALTPVAA